MVKRILILLLTIIASAAHAQTSRLIVVWTDEAGLWAWQEGDAAPRALITDQNAASAIRLLEPGFSPDKQSVAYLESKPQAAQYALEVIDLSGKLKRHFALLSERIIWQSAWQNNQTILFNTYTIKTDEQTTRYANNDDLWRADLSSGQLTQVCPDGQGGKFLLSPKQDRIALIFAGRYADQTPGRISVTDIDCQQRLQLFQFPFVNSASSELYYPAIAWQPDGSAVQSAIPDPKLVYDTESKLLTHLWRRPLSGAAAEIGTIQADFFNGLSWSEDGKSLLYVRRSGDLSANRIALMLAQADGKNARQIAAGGIGLISKADWLPGSQHFSYSTEDGILWIGAMDQPPYRLGSYPIWRPIWTADGTYVYLNDPGSAGELYYATLTDPQPRRIGSPHAPVDVIAARLS